MCNDCHMKPEAHSEGNRLILQRVTCKCDRCDVVEFEEDGSRCVSCGHKLDVTLTDDADGWEAKPIWTPDGRPIRRDEIVRTAE